MSLFHVYIATSLDGYIADREGGVGWLDPFQPEKFDFSAFLDSVDALLMGRASYDAVRSFGDWPYGDRPTVVMTSRPIPDAPACVGARSGDIADAVAELEAAGHARVWVLGGGRIVSDLMKIGRVDRLELAVIPVILGEGVSLFPSIADISTPAPTVAVAGLTLTACEPAGANVARLVYDRA